VSKRRRGGRYTEIQLQAARGTYDDDVLEFIQAIDRVRREQGRPFLSSSQIYEVFIQLGYRKPNQG
jgi:hypothetical protein